MAGILATLSVLRLAKAVARVLAPATKVAQKSDWRDGQRQRRGI